MFIEGLTRIWERIFLYNFLISYIIARLGQSYTLIIYDKILKTGIKYDKGQYYLTICLSLMSIHGDIERI